MRNVEIWVVLSSKEVDLLMFKKSSLRVRNVEICAVQSSNEVDCSCSVIAFSGMETIRNVQCSHERTLVSLYSGIVF